MGVDDVIPFPWGSMKWFSRKGRELTGGGEGVWDTSMGSLRDHVILYSGEPSSPCRVCSAGALDTCEQI